jgi:hypothetical protein
MGFKDIFDLGPVLPSPFDIWAHFPERVNDGRLSLAFYIIGALGQATGINLFYCHDVDFLINYSANLSKWAGRLSNRSYTKKKARLKQADLCIT